MKHSLSSRNPAMDVIRCLALFGVTSVHFFLHTGYYMTLLTGTRMYLATLIRMASMTCVPLFLLLSGYLMKNKTPTRQYYSKLIRIVCLYFLASLCCYLYQNRLSGSFLSFLLDTLNYTAAPYAWYMNMYFGLFLLIPYLNILYNNLPGENSRRGLILTLLILTSFTEVFNGSLYFPETGWQLSGDPSLGQILMPDWWKELYPLTYYFLGAYLKDHPLKLRRRNNVLLLLLAVLGNGTLNYFISYNQTFLGGTWQSWGSILNVIQSVLLFNLLACMEFKGMSVRTAQLLARMSELSLSAFLVSWIFDNLVYSTLGRLQPVTAYQISWYPVTTVLVFSFSLLLSWILDTLYSLAASGVRSLSRRKSPT